MPTVKPATRTGANLDTQEIQPITREQRYQMIADAAYFRAESKGFVGDSAQYWVEAEAKVDRALLQSGQLAPSPKQILQQKLEAQLKELDALYETIKLQTSLGKAELRSELEKQLDALSHKRHAAQVKLHELSKRTEGAWDDLKDGTEKTWDDMRQTINHIANRFR